MHFQRCLKSPVLLLGGQNFQRDRAVLTIDWSFGAWDVTI